MCSSPSKLFSFRVDPFSNSNLLQRSKQEFRDVNITLFFAKKEAWVLLDQERLFGLIRYAKVIGAKAKL